MRAGGQLLGAAGTVGFLLVDALGLDPIGIGRWQWWALGSFMLFIVTVYWQVIKLNLHVGKLEAKPRPNVVFTEPSPAYRPVTSIMRLSRSDERDPFGGSAVRQTKAAHFARAAFRNTRRESPPTVSVDRPHVTISYYNQGGQMVASVKNGRIAEAKERFEMNEKGIKQVTAAEARLGEIRVGEPFTVDLAVRFSDDAPAHSWSNDDPAIGNEEMPPGQYKVKVEIDAENLTETQVEWFLLTVPNELAVDLPLSRITE